MKLEVRIGEDVRQIEIERKNGTQFAARVDAGPQVDALEVAPNTYSILLDGRSFEAVVVPTPEGALVRCGGHEFHASIADPRAWRGGRGGVFEKDGQQQINAPMPGKVVRILVAVGDEVEPDQGVMVVEAMKMQNEVRASKGGKVERIFVREGQAVAAGEALVAIH